MQGVHIELHLSIEIANYKQIRAVGSRFSDPLAAALHLEREYFRQLQGVIAYSKKISVSSLSSSDKSSP